jgi:hypothetical protein
VCPREAQASTAEIRNAVPGRVLQRILSRVTRVGAVVGAIVLIVAGAAGAGAQTLMAGGALEMGIERFNGDPAMNRLDGSAAGWAVMGDVRFGRISARVEGWSDGAIEDAATINLVANGRAVTIHSSLAHDAHAFAALVGYVGDVSSHVQVAGVGGISSITVTRTFTTDAGQLILVSPSTVPTGPTTVRTVDRFMAWSAGADVIFRTSNRIRIMAGLRSEPLRLTSDISGVSVRLLGGVVWMIR